MKIKFILTAFTLCVFISIQAQFTSTTATKIATDYQTNWSVNAHPRLFGTSLEMQRTKDLYLAGDVLVKKTVDQIIADADIALTKTIPVWGLDAANLRISAIHTISKEFLPQLPLAFYFTANEKYAKRAWEVAKVLMTYQDWGVAITSPYKDRHFLDAGVGSFNAAMLYDGLYSWTNQTQKDSLYNMTKKYIFTPVLAQYNGTASKSWSWMYANNNWNGICNGGVIAACLTMFEHDKTLLSDIASRAINCFPNYINAFEPDGQSEEGLMYWSYGLMYASTAFDIMQRTLGTTYGYSKTNGMKKTGYFPVYTSGPVATLNVGDDGVRNSRQNTMMWFAKHNNDSTLAKFSYDLFMDNGQKMNWFDLFHYSPKLVAKGKELNVGLDNYIRGIDIYSFVEKWKDRNAIYLGVHAGSNTANHGHLDAGSFYIQALGEYWAYGNLGSDTYTNPGYFDFGAGNNDCLPSYTATNTAPTVSQSWHFYRKRAEGKNTVVYNPDYRADEDPTQEAVYKGYINSSDNVGCGLINMNMIYSRDVNTHTRGFKLDRTRRMITIQDNISAKVTKSIWWSMHTKAAITLSTDKRTAILTQNGKSMTFVLRSPETATFQSLQATYLESRTFPLTNNSSNADFRKLAINLKDTKDAVIRIEAYPTLDGDKEELIDDYEGFGYNYSPISLTQIETNIQNPVIDAVNSSDLVLKLTKLANAVNYSGLKTSNKTITIGLGKGQYRYLKVKLLKSTTAPVQLKLQQTADNTSADYVAINATTKTAQWEEFTFDLLTDAANVSQEGKSFNGITLVPENSSTSNSVTYIDDLRLSNVIDDKPVNIVFSQKKVEGIVYEKRTSSTCVIKWKKIIDATKYNVYKDKQFFTSIADTSLIINNLITGANYKFSVTAQNINLQPSISSDELSLVTRLKTTTNEIIDNFENVFVPWTVVGSNVSIYPDQANPASSVINPSAKTMKITRMAYGSNGIGLALLQKDMYDLSILPHYLHIKMYRGAVAGGLSVELSNSVTGAILKRLKPVNAIDTLTTLKWVDFVFDLTGSEPSSVYDNLKIFPDHTASYSSTKNYFIDDIIFSTMSYPYTSISNTMENDKYYSLKKTGNSYVFKSSLSCNIQIINMSGQVCDQYTKVNEFEINRLTLKAGVYLLRIDSNGKTAIEKLIF
jgi:hypothetical protein